MYRARDATLDREVAIKVLPSLFTSDPRRSERFEREARLLASLNHPNIATIHGVEHARGINALVLELVEGETLAERLRSTAAQSKTARGLPLASVVSIARQIADALEAAHEKGIVHRDLKPANVMLRRDGVVKLLDFGLAKGGVDDRRGALPAGSLATGESTDAGAIAGTAAYMSPEQARGEPVDRRADVWAFGCVLYEMLAGRRAFAGRGTSDVLAAIVGSAPDFGALAAETPDGLRRLLRRALTKDPVNRLRDIGDARLELIEALGDGSASRAGSGAAHSATAVRGVAAVTWARRATRILLPLGAGAFALAIVLTFGRADDRPWPAAAKIVGRFELIPPESAPLLPNTGNARLAISTDGTRTQIAYLTNRGVAVRSLDRFDVRVIEARAGLTLLPSRLGPAQRRRWRP